MPKFDQVVVVLPCHALEDFPIHETGDKAESLLASWTAAWHPGLLAHTKNIPNWTSEDFINIDLDHSLIFVPISCGEKLADDFDKAVSDKGSVIVPRAIKRDSILCDPTVASLLDQSFDPNFVNDFFALGYAYLQIQLMTRQLRYSTTIDVEELQRRTVAAAIACTDKKQQETKQALTSCFDLLLEERNNFYPTDPQLLNLVLVPPSCNLANQLETRNTFNALASGSRLRQLADKYPGQLALAKDLVTKKKLEFVATAENELPVQFLGIESLLRQCTSGLQTQQELLGDSGSTFGSYEFGLGAQLPNILDNLEFQSALHVTFSGGQLPNTSAPVINWQGMDGTNISSFSGTLIDANSPEGFLSLGVTVGEMLDGYHHCDLMMVNWPDRTCDWFDAIVAIERYCSLFGSFVTLNQFTETIYDSGFSDTFTPDDYQFPYLETAFTVDEANPISRWQTNWRWVMRLTSLKTFATSARITGMQTYGPSIFNEIDALQHELEANLKDDSKLEKTYQRISQFVDKHFGKTTELLCGTANDLELSSDSSLFNPGPSPKSNQHIPSGAPSTSIQIAPYAFVKASQLFANDFVAARDPAVLDFTKDGLPILRNEFFELRIDDQSGGIRSVHRTHQKTNLFSQQIAGRLSESYTEHGHSRQKSHYTSMRLKDILTHADSNRRGMIRTLGELVDENPRSDSTKVIAEYDQTVSLQRGSNRIYFEITIDLKQPICGNPWRNYIGNRIAWANEDANVYRSDHEIADQVYREKFVSPQFVEVSNDDSKITLLSAGIPYHRRSSRRTLDTLLVVHNESVRKFNFAIAIDAPTSIGAAIDYLTPCLALDSDLASTMPEGWIFHLNYKNVIITNMQPLFDEQQETCGVELRLQETQGRSGELHLSCPYSLVQAFRCSFSGKQQFELKTEKEIVVCNFLAWQFFQLRIYWKT